METYKEEKIMENNEIEGEILPSEFKKELVKFVKITNEALKLLHISVSDKNIFYQRNEKGESILGIKLVSGNDDDKTNYMINISKVSNLGKN